ncbi:DNA polymerase III subunit alpha [Buchnera aphidicola (Kurisakia onigurumii)]|uniref:DNA polymerase III subunit alpha n=1 Tax=Buchnera aphidicola TaxID=9 RepID=UPI0031B7265E
MNSSNFVHLNTHSDYSIIDGIASPEKIVHKANSLGMSSIGITDFSNLFGALKFYLKAHEYGIKPIIGIDFNMRSIFIPNMISRITLLAYNKIGYRNLSILTTYSHKEKTNYSQAILKQELLKKYNQGLIILSGGCFGDIGICLLKNNNKFLNSMFNFYSNYFPESHYLELTRTNRVNEEEYISKVLYCANKKQVPVVATNSVCFLNKEDFSVHNIRMGINQGIMISDINKKKNYSKEQFLKSQEEMINLFYDIPESIVNTVEISMRCNFIFNLNKYFLPTFFDKKFDVKKKLIEESFQGLEYRFKNYIFKNQKNVFKTEKKYIARLNLELDIINKMGFPSYFLIVMEFIQWAKKNNIPVGPGRGSGAGSLVAYALKITELDPLKFDLLFERFLNLDRVSMPDFDIDFCMEKRDLVIEHVSKKYGSDSVAQIITFGTMTAKSVIRDVGRVLGYPYGFINKLSKLIPLDPGITLNKAFSTNQELIELYSNNTDVKSIVNIAKKLEGVTRNIGKHAGGVIIAPSKIINFVPLYFDENGKNVLTQFDKDDIEKIGLVKFDFLGLKTLTIIESCVRIINSKLHNKKVDIKKISLEDKKVFDMLNNANTTAIFQLESLGMKKLIKRLKPDCFEDIISLVALFRPGPLQSGMVDNFIARKHGKESIFYPDKKWQHILLKPILESTYGIILYQEQVMQIAQVLSGYSLSDADILRRVMGKKDPVEMRNQYSIFQSGAKKNGIDVVLSKKIFSLLEKFSGYGFNKSHSAAYALISYQTLWLKSHYPAEFMASVMTSEIDNSDKLSNLILECKKLNIKILPPCINHGFNHFYVNEKKEIIYGMGAIKGIGINSINSIVKHRTLKIGYLDLFDFCVKTNSKKITVIIIKKLIKSGSLDCFKLKRSFLINSLLHTFNSAKQYKKIILHKQKDIFNPSIQDFKNIVKNKNLNVLVWTKSMKLDYEYSVLGLCITGYPIREYLFELNKYVNAIKLKNIKLQKNNSVVCVFGVISYIKRILTKKNTQMVLISIDDSYCKLDVLIFENLLERKKYFIKKNNIVIIQGKVIFDNFIKKKKIIAIDIIDIDYARLNSLSEIIVFTKVTKNIDKLFVKIKKITLTKNNRTIPLNIYFYKNNEFVQLKYVKKWKIFPNNKLINNLKYLFGIGSVKLKRIKNTVSKIFFYH